MGGMSIVAASAVVSRNLDADRRARRRIAPGARARSPHRALQRGEFESLSFSYILRFLFGRFDFLEVWGWIFGKVLQAIFAADLDFAIYVSVHKRLAHVATWLFTGDGAGV